MAFNRGPEKTPFWKSQVRSSTQGSTPRGKTTAGPRRGPSSPGIPREEPSGKPVSRPRPFTPGSYSANPDGTRGLGPRPKAGPPFRPAAARPYGSRTAPASRPYGPRTASPARPGPSQKFATPEVRPPFQARSPRPPFRGPKPPFVKPPATRPQPGPRPAPARSSRAPFDPQGPPEVNPGGAPARTPAPPRPDHIEPDTDSTETLPTAYLKPGEADRILAGHPWVYESSILRLTRKPDDGDVVQVKDHRRRLLGVGFYNAQSKIRVRILSPHRVEIDDAFLEARLRSAIDHRRRFMPEATSLRLVNAEGDQLSGLIVDRYEDVLVIQMSSLGMDRRKDSIARILTQLLSPRAIVERNDMSARQFEGLPEHHGVVAGNLQENELAALPLRLNGLAFEANLVSGHKTGLYLDQQLNHALVSRFARGARVLDAFTFLGGFALAAARAGAASVLGLDQSEEAVATARRLAQANGLDSVCSFESANVFDWLRQRTGTGQAAPGPDTQPPTGPDAAFDLIILDPPSFTRNRASIGDALRGYKEIHLRALKLLAPGGILATFCCSHHVDAQIFEAVVREAATDARRALRRVAAYTQAPDHPILPAIPETEYLKGYAYEVLPP